ncbi:MAG TPA: PQQ-dependent dehydrogenase, methanol/ethanol family, partial [Beijerinckiaceae bacterium]
MRRSIGILLSAIIVMAGAGGDASSQTPPPPAPPAAAAPPDDGQWTSPAKNHANTRYSELDEINAGNVEDLQV